MARVISDTSIREYRKHFHLQANGQPIPGHEEIAGILLDCVRLVQAGKEKDAIELALHYGVDLAANYQRRRAGRR